MSAYEGLNDEEFVERLRREFAEERQERQRKEEERQRREEEQYLSDISSKYPNNNYYSLPSENSYEPYSSFYNLREGIHPKYKQREEEIKNIFDTKHNAPTDISDIILDMAYDIDRLELATAQRKAEYKMDEALELPEDEYDAEIDRLQKLQNKYKTEELLLRRYHQENTPNQSHDYYQGGHR